MRKMLIAALLATIALVSPAIADQWWMSVPKEGSYSVSYWYGPFRQRL